jgi:tRNA pseudouridine55 synthase
MMVCTVPELNGFLNIRKPQEITSAGLVEAIRGQLKVPCGHAGTLDPMAEGVLVVAVGESRKFIRFLHDDKEYDATMRLGQESDTLDSTGNLTLPVPVAVADEKIRETGRELVGEIEMPVPLYSAIRVAGQRLYKLARDGIAVTPPSRRSRIFSIEIFDIRLPDVRFRTICAAGTYIRSLAAKWGQSLGCGAHLTALTRLRSGSFALANARPHEEIEALFRNGRIADALVSARMALAHLPEMTADHKIALTGRPLPAPPEFKSGDGQHVRLINLAGDLIGVGRATAGPDGVVSVHPERMTAEH